MLVLVAAGLLATAVHTAHEAGWCELLQEQAFDFTWLVAPGHGHAALLTGMLGLQPRPTVGETVVYLLYAIPMLIYVLWPRSGWRSGRLRAGRVRLGRRERVVSRRAPARGRRGRPRRSLPLGAVRLRLRGPARRAQDRRREDHRRRLRAGRADDRRRARRRSTSRTTAPTTSPSSRCSTATGSSARPRTSRRASSGKFSLTLDEGAYTTYCPGGDTSERGVLIVDGRRRHGGRRRRGRRRRRSATATTSSEQTARSRSTRPRPSWPRSRPATWRGEGGCTRRRASRTSGSSRSPRASATSTRRSTRAKATCRRRMDGVPSDREDALGRRARPRDRRRSRRKLLRRRKRAADAGRRRSSSSRRRSRTARSSCSARCRSRRSPARRSATPTSTSSTSRRTSRARRPRSTPSRRSLARQDPSSRARSTAEFAAVDDGARRLPRGRWLRLLHRAEATSDTRTLSQAIDALAEPLSQVAALIVAGHERRATPRLTRRAPARAAGLPRRAGIALGGIGIERADRERLARGADLSRSTASTRPASRRPPRTGSTSPRST